MEKEYTIKTEKVSKLLEEQTSISQFIESNKDIFVDESLAEYLHILLKQKKLTISTFVDHTQLAKSYIYKIFNGDKIPTKDKLLQLVFTFGASLEEAQMMFKRANIAPLYSKNLRDSIIIFCIHKKYDVFKVNDELINNKEKPLFDLY